MATAKKRGIDSTLPRRPYQQITQHLSFAAALLIITLGSVYSNWLQRVDLLIYDTHQRFWSHPAPDDIVIIAVDEYSLAQLGRWPWPRRTHAELIDKLTAAGAKAVILDIIFAEPDQYDLEGDILLSQAISRHGNVVLPVLFEQRYAGGQLIETLPLPQLIAHTHSLGHAHVELDADGITRSVYLKEGLANAYWPHLSVAILEMLNGGIPSLPGTRNPTPEDLATNLLIRDYHVMTPYAGPPGHFRHISYAQLIDDPTLLATLKDKIVFIGATATGLGDLLPTPVSALNQPMAGVEINANIFDALRSNTIIEPMPFDTHMLLSVLITLLPVLMFPRLSPRAALFMSATLLLGTMALSTLFLVEYHVWFPPAAIMLALILAYPIWSWRRLEYANKFLSQELQRLHAEPTLSAAQSKDIEKVMEFIVCLVSIKGWALYNHRSRCIAQWGDKPDIANFNDRSVAWLAPDKELLTWNLGISMENGVQASPKEQALVLDVIQPYLAEAKPSPSSSIELFEARVIQVQQAENRIRTMRRFLDDSLEQMADGVLVINNLGQLSIINAQAISLLGEDKPAEELRNEFIMPLLSNIHLQGNEDWQELLAQALMAGSTAQAYARTHDNKDLFIQLSPLSLEREHVNGVIINLSDITHIRDAERQRVETFSFLSHDLRAPLTSLIALVEMSKQNRACDKEFLERVEMYASRTLNLAEDFLQLSKLEHMVELRSEIIDIGMIVSNAIDAIWDHSSKKKIKVNELIPEDPIYVEGDPKLLERAILNLISNAVKYSEENTEVSISVDTKDSFVLCCVKDQGFGIPEKSLNRIFDRYFRIDSEKHSEVQGSGLGLSFVKSVVEKHHGELDVESSVGEGSTFCMRLPLTVEPA